MMLEALHRACRDGMINSVMQRISQASDIDALGPDGLNALHHASMGNHMWIARFLHETCSAGLHVLTKAGDPPLSCASSRGCTAVIRYLIAAGADLNRRGNHGASALHYACCHDQYDAMEVLLAAGADVDLRNDDGQTPLFDACCTAAGLRNVERLIDAVADPQVRDTNGLTPLHVACHHGLWTTIQALTAAGAKTSVVCCGGWTLLHQVTSERCPMDSERRMLLVRWLLDRGVPINAKTGLGTTALHQLCSAREQHMTLIRLMIRRGADVRATDAMMRTVLSRAVRYGHPAATRLLIQHGAVQRPGDSFPGLVESPVWQSIDGSLRHLQWFASGFLTAIRRHRGIGGLLYGCPGCMATIAQFCCGADLETLRRARRICFSGNEN